MKRILTILGIIIVVACIVLIGMWIFDRRASKQAGARPASFREFITGTATTNTSSGEPGATLDSVFTDPNQTGSGTTSGGTAGTINTATSTFTNPGTLSPSSDIDSIFNPSIEPGDRAGTGADGGGTDVIIPGTSAIVFSGCSEEDQNIRFTDQELTDLRGLQNRFYQVATTLHTDADVSAELANFSNYKQKVDRIIELNTYCSTKKPNLVGADSAQMKRTVPTPFWRNSATDILAGYFNIVPFDYYGGKFQAGDIIRSKANLEMALRLNLW